VKFVASSLQKIITFAIAGMFYGLAALFSPSSYLRERQDPDDQMTHP
jgi:hypothetical protein